jgi:hypothetical protein
MKKTKLEFDSEIQLKQPHRRKLFLGQIEALCASI